MLATHLSRAVFNLCHGNQLVYNTCWEDPRLDRVALELNRSSRVLVITSAGCNALDYALDEPERIDTVDMNSRQNALLDLKLAAIRELEYEQFFQLFGRGKTDNWEAIYNDALRNRLPEKSRKFWDKHGRFFLGKGKRPSFYFRGSAGLFASGVNYYINRWAKVREDIDHLLAAETVEEQRELYETSVKPAIWGPKFEWVMRRDAVLSLLGVPRAQRQQLERYYPGGISKFVEDSLDTVFSKLPLKDNYFWRVYLTGEYTPECCPEYLKPENFARLKGTDDQPGLAERIHTNTTTILEHLQQTDRNYTHYVLLDHMDWMAEHMHDVLGEQWQAILDHSDEGARFLWRSAAVKCEFVDPIQVNVDGVERRLGEVLDYNRELAEELHAIDRVHTYGSFSIATLRRDGGVAEQATQVEKSEQNGNATHHQNGSANPSGIEQDPPPHPQGSDNPHVGPTQDAVPPDPVAHPG